jgi:hypothetical protein
MNTKQLNKLLNQIKGTPMTSKQIQFRAELRGKVFREEITVTQAHEIWKQTYGK